MIIYSWRPRCRWGRGELTTLRQSGQTLIATNRGGSRLVQKFHNPKLATLVEGHKVNHFKHMSMNNKPRAVILDKLIISSLTTLFADFKRKHL